MTRRLRSVEMSSGEDGEACPVKAVKAGSGWLRCVEVSSGQIRRLWSFEFRLGEVRRGVSWRLRYVMERRVKV